ncbi:MAG: hypothetical protein U5K69_02545 [Balneolaceae bacterium]|nr:hypothetical protein [Balneolaceae bacterium]
MSDKNKDREKALEMAIGQIEKQHGKGTIMRLGEEANQNVPSISTGSIMVDYALGIGGIPAAGLLGNLRTGSQR